MSRRRLHTPARTHSSRTSVQLCTIFSSSSAGNSSSRVLVLVGVGRASAKLQRRLPAVTSSTGAPRFPPSTRAMMRTPKRLRLL